MSAGVAEAQVCVVKPSETVLIRPGRSREFYSLVAKKLYQEAVRCCAACLVTAGTKVVLTNAGVFSHTVRVIDGPSRDCVGDLAVEEISCR
jgi:plastocyanin